MVGNLPTKLENPERQPRPSQERLDVEGEVYSLVAHNAASPVSVATGPVNTTVTSTSLPPTIGQCVFVREIRYGLDNKALAQIVITGDGGGGGLFNSFTVQDLVAAGATEKIHPDQFIRAHEVTNGSVALAVRNNLTGGSVNYIGVITVLGRLMTDDFNYDAKYTIPVFGDSISRLQGATATRFGYQFILRDWLISQGYDCRLVLKAKSGSTSTQHEDLRKTSYPKVLGHVGMKWWALGTNDAAQGIAAATTVGNLAAAWDEHRLAFPGIPFVAFGCPPILNATFEANAAQQRSDIATFVAARRAIGQTDLYFVDLGTAWTATDATKTTDGIHPNNTGNALLASTAIAAFITQSIRPR